MKIAILFLLFAASVHAHDFWIELSDWSPEEGKAVQVFLKSGHAPEGASLARQETTTGQFVVVDSEKTLPVPGLIGRKPAGIFRPGSLPLVVAYTTQTRTITLDAQRFDHHLVQEGLTQARASRQKASHEDSPAREQYVKYAKCLARSENGSSQSAPLQLGQDLEIVPDTDPTLPGFAGKLTGRVLSQGSAAGDLQVCAYSPGSSETLMTRTAPDGRFILALPHEGIWIIKSVRMSASATPDHDWESRWASLSFRFGK